MVLATLWAPLIQKWTLYENGKENRGRKVRKNGSWVA